MADQPEAADPAGIELAEPSIERLVRAHHEAVFRLAYRLCGSVPDAEDLTQQVFLQAHAKVDQLRDLQRGRSWLFAILRNCFLKSRQRPVPVPVADADVRIEELPDPAAADSDIDGEALQAALNGLSEDFRLVLAMFYFEQLSYQEIAEALDLPLGTVMSRLARAKGHLRRRLAQRAGCPTHEADGHAEEPRRPAAPAALRGAHRGMAPDQEERVNHG